MPKKIQDDTPLTGRLVDFSAGQNDAVHPALLNDNESVKSYNASLEEKGTLKPRKGSLKRYSADFDASNPVAGMGVFYKSNGTTRLLMAAGTTVYYDEPHLENRWDTQAQWQNTGTITWGDVSGFTWGDL